MEEISDNEFDRLFKEKSQNFDYEFEEEAWDLMEKKLRKRDRVVYIQRFSIAALVLFFLGAGLYLFSDKPVSNSVISQKGYKKDSVSIAANTHSDNLANSGLSSGSTIEDTSPTNRSTTIQSGNGNLNNSYRTKTDIKFLYKTTKARSKQRLAFKKDIFSHDKSLQQPEFNISLWADDRKAAQTLNTESVHIKNGTTDSLSYLASVKSNEHVQDSIIPTASVEDSHINRLVKIATLKTKPKFSFTLAAGPDYSSIQSLKGRQGNLNLGLLLNLSYKRFMFSTGAKYGLKKYSAGAFDYALNNPANAYNISEINAACNVLEIPAQLSYTAFRFNKQRIDVTGGLSSYLMLKENYQFCYKPETGRPDYYLQKDNANQSYFGVMSFSASYKFKPLKQNILIGIEPYAKLPLGGVGEGKVKLKSSGVALTMTYELIKRN